MSRDSLPELMAKMQAALSAIDPDALEQVEKARARFELLAKEYEGTSGVLRRRAGHQSNMARAAELEQSADRFRRRAEIMRAAAAAPATVGLPVARMPADLRTPAESLDLVDDFRRDLAALLANYRDMTEQELGDFVRALPIERTGRTPWLALQSTIVTLIGCLGVPTAGTFIPFRDPRIFPLPEPSNDENGPPSLSGEATQDRPKGTIDHEQDNR